MKTFTIKVPAGIRDGEKIRLLGQGKKGSNGGNNGDLFIKIKVDDDARFRLDGYDLITDLYLTPWEAALGTRVTISGMDEDIALFVPPGIQSGEKVRIANKGYYINKEDRGDLVAEIKVVVPNNISKEEKKLYEQLKAVSNFNPRT